MFRTVTPTQQTRQARFAGWLAVAVLLHALLLLIPVRQGPSSGPAAKSLAVVLTRALQAAPDAPSEDRGAAAEEPLPPPPETPGAPEPAASSTPGRPLADAPSPAAASPARTVNAARLLDLANPREWLLPGKEEPRRLGDFTPPPQDWPSGTSLGPSRFDGRALSETVEIVDRWLAADGSHNVMVETPNGEMLCGRAAAWDPMQPLVEHVMMFRSCGPARSTFEWPEHYATPRARQR